MSICATGSRRAPTKPAPIRPESPRPKIGQRQSRRDLVGGEAEHHEPNRAAISQPASSRRATPSDVESNVMAAAKPQAAPIDHHALDAEVQHARALGHELADGRDEQRRRRGDDGEQDGFESAHVRPAPRARSACGSA